MIYGLGAALGWGLSDITVAIVSRRIGSFLAVVIGQSAGLVLFGILLVVAHPPLPNPGTARLAILLALGVTGALSYMAFYRGLQLGPVALVTPIVAGYSGIVIGLSLLILHETVAALALAGAGVILTGVLLTSTDVRALRARTRVARGGPFFALVAMAGFGVGAFIIGRISQDLGWFETVLIGRLGSAVTLGVIVAYRRQALSVPRRSLWPALAAGVLDILGFAAFARGSELGFEAITAAASAVYPLIPVVAGVVYLHERPTAPKWAGVGLVITGLILLAVGR